MACSTFNTVSSIIFAVYLCHLLDTGLLADSDSKCSPPKSTDPSQVYYEESDEGDFGIRMTHEPHNTDKPLNIIISYETETNSAANFFKTQISTLIDDFSQCNVIAWNFNPCTLSQLGSDGTLSCPHGLPQCRNDQIHACLAQAFKSQAHPEKMGKFLICVFSCTGKSTDQCALEAGYGADKLKLCIDSGIGRAFCVSFHNDFENAKTVKTKPTVEQNQRLPDVIINFKSTVCTMLKEVGLKCDAVCSE